MTDVLIRNVNPKTVKGLEDRARGLGLAREEYLRRELDVLARMHIALRVGQCSVAG
ncbi:MAG: hypothetical protein FWD74_02065 [Actinomycetia bacterium]|nr:hypothetical protein [Actinomycetes bacterium]